MKLKYLDIYGEMLSDMVCKISNDLEKKTDEQLREIISEAKSLTQTNCAWSNYRVSRTVIQEAESILYIREKAREVKGD